MSDLIKILQEHREIMSQLGYQEIGLGTVIHKEDYPEFDDMELREVEYKPWEKHAIISEDRGQFMKRLEESFSSHLQQSFFKKTNREFDVKAVGFFNDEKHLVSFQFHYELRAREGKIVLKSMKADMDSTCKEFNLPKGLYDLPPVSKVISLLEKEKENRIGETVHISQPLVDEYNILRYKQALSAHEILLAKRGYTNKEFFPYRDNFLFKKIESKFSKRYWDQNERQDFFIRTQGFFNDQNDEVKFNFFYEVNQEEKALQLNSFVAELGEKRICYPLGENDDLPPALQVWKQLTNELKQGRAEIIYPKEKIKILLREQERFLGAIGYYKTVFSNSTDFVERELKGILEKSLIETDVQIIPINREIHLSAHHSFQCLFQYAFDPVQVNLKMESLTANVSAIEKKYSREDFDGKLTIQKIYSDLSNDSILSKARRVADNPRRDTPVHQQRRL